MVKRALLLLCASSLPLANGAVSMAVAAPVVMRGEDAMVLATRLIADGKLDEADEILRTLAAGDQGELDLRQVDRLAAKIAFARGDHDRAVTILRAVTKSNPHDWRVRYDLAHVAMDAHRDRLAERELRRILTMGVDQDIRARVRNDLKQIADRRLVRMSFRASAAPSTNINTATAAETFDFAGVIPFELSDDARARSGIGMNWSLGGRLSPQLGRGVKGHFAVNSTLTDHSHRGFDQLTTGVEAGVQHRLGDGPGGLETTLAATYGRRALSGDAYSTSVGAKLSIATVLSSRAALRIGLAVEDVDYDLRDDRDGWVTSVSGAIQFALNQRVRLSGALSLAREDAAAASEANTQTALSTGVHFAGPWGSLLGVQPSVYFRNFDAVAFVYGEKRKDLTADIALSVAHNRVQYGGFRPSFVYRYTENNSTVELFSYDRHSVDIAFSRAF